MTQGAKLITYTYTCTDCGKTKEVQINQARLSNQQARDLAPEGWTQYEEGGVWKYHYFYEPLTVWRCSVCNINHRIRQQAATNS